MKSDRRIKIFSIIVLLLIILSASMIRTTLAHGADKLEKEIIALDHIIDREDWEAAIKSSGLLNKDWHKFEPIWTLFVNHHEIDNITIALVKSTSYIQNKDKVSAIAHLQELREFIKHIPEMETISIRNIL